jgi:isopentenyl-diphosphate delta-isomerase
MEEMVILVDDNDNEIGLLEKMKAHVEGKLHRAFSIFIFNSKNETLMQQRADHKYHSPGVWSNTCCSHPRSGETLEEAVQRRLQEEMGFSTKLKEIFAFTYKTPVGKGSDGQDLTEHEFDHVFIGNFEGDIKINPEEVSNFCWMTLEQVKSEIDALPKKYSQWLKIMVEKHNLLEKVNNYL